MSLQTWSLGFWHKTLVSILRIQALQLQSQIQRLRIWSLPMVTSGGERSLQLSKKRPGAINTVRLFHHQLGLCWQGKGNMLWPANCVLVPSQRWTLWLWSSNNWLCRSNILWGAGTEGRVSLCRRKKIIATVAKETSLWRTRRSRRTKTERIGKRICTGGGKAETIFPSRSLDILYHVRFNMVYESLYTRKHMVTYSTSDLWRKQRPFRTKCVAMP
jgi:hypothetical protein